MSPYIFTILAMLAFAANSILCRLALGENTIDAAGFTAIRLLSGATMLALIILYRRGSFTRTGTTPLSALALFTYAICFSFSYIELATGTGALILFGSVQLTMILFGLIKGERPGKLAWAGIFVATAGLVYLLLPGASAPRLFHAMLMIIAGIAWGAYSLLGKGATNPLTATAMNFIWTIPLALLVIIFFRTELFLTSQGILLAVASGAVASGLGYAIWYRALPHLSPTNAATVQLSVPVIAAFGGILVISEPVTVRLLVAGIVVLGGIYLTIRSNRQ